MVSVTGEDIISLIIAAIVFGLLWYFLNLRRLKKQDRLSRETVSEARKDAIKSTIIFAGFYFLLSLIL